MTIQQIIFIVIGGMFALFFGFLFLFEAWKKLWLTSVGEVLDVQVPRNISTHRKGLSVIVHYRYIFLNQEHQGNETKTVNVAYHDEDEALKNLQNQFPVGGKVAVYHPRNIPEISSITPGGAMIPRLILAAVWLGVYLTVMYYYVLVASPIR